MRNSVVAGAAFAAGMLTGAASLHIDTNENEAAAANAATATHCLETYPGSSSDDPYFQGCLTDGEGDYSGIPTASLEAGSSREDVEGFVEEEQSEVDDGVDVRRAFILFAGTMVGSVILAPVVQPRPSSRG
ncbi:MAG TPA: hypothetical protein VK674_03150 [Candidatus Limnocylindria bacterium]|nr:hypothetical protein [Candidatus Limnocylindria bacterium]